MKDNKTQIERNELAIRNKPITPHTIHLLLHFMDFGTIEY